MKNEFDEKQDLSQPPARLQNRGLELSPRQSEIYRNLEAIGPEIAAFYLDGIRILQNEDLETAANLLGHITREIDGGLRNILSEDRKEELEFVVSMPDGRKLPYEKGKEGSFKFESNVLGTVKVTYKRIGKHKVSILQSLGIDDLSPLAERWLEVTEKFHKFAHRRGAWETPRKKETFIPLWNEFEDVLEDLVGNYLNLLSKVVDRILAREEPTEEIIKTLPKLLKARVRYAYFFNNLNFSAWLKPLKDAGWFDPDSQLTSHEMLDQPGMYTVTRWYAMIYLKKIANDTKEPLCDDVVRDLVAIINDVVTYINDNQERVPHQYTIRDLVEILETLPLDRLERQHIVFLWQALQWDHPLIIGNKIEQKFLPKLLNAKARGLTLVFLEVMLNDRDMISVMEKQVPAIVKLCGIEAVNIAIKQIHNIIAEHPHTFTMLQRIEVVPSEELLGYDELLVHFICSLLRLAESDSIAEMVEDLLQKSHDIFKRIALHAITHHYEDLKQLFWKWQGNPLEDTLLKPELYRLLQTNCRAFDEFEIEQVLQWIESEQDMVSSKDDETRSKQEAYRKREWLSALMETGNEKVVSAYHKYKQINPAKLERPGLLFWTSAWEGQTSPTTIEELSGMSNAQIAVLLNAFKDKGISGPSVPTEEGLAEMLEEYVALNPQRFVNDLQPFQGVRNFYQYWILRGILKAWNDKREFDWEKLLDFVYRLVSSERFWTEHHETRYGGHSEWIFAVAELIESGTRDGEYTFDVKLLPLAEKILLVLVEKVELRPSTFENVPMAVVNSDRGQVFSAMVNYALQFSRVHSGDQVNRWPQAIKADFTKRLDRSVEPSLEFSFTLGMYLTYLLYLDETWLIDNIDRIFPQQDEYHWHIAFSGYLLYSPQLYKPIYAAFKKHGHYQKALNSDFCNRRIDARVLPEPDVVYLDSQRIDRTADRVVREKLVSNICLGWMEQWETLEDETSLIYQLVNSDNPNLLSTLIHFFWKKRDNLPEQLKTKVLPTWRALYESLSQKDDIEKYAEVLSRLSGWVALVDEIDTEVLKWLKMSTQHIRDFRDSVFFVEDLLPHATKTPAKVGDIYLGMLTHNVYPYHDQEHIQEIIRGLYSTGYKDVADRICNLYGEAGFDFLRSLYDENQN